jgi:ArsR family transcriptional regulator
MFFQKIGRTIYLRHICRAKQKKQAILMNKHTHPLLPAHEKLRTSLAVMRALAHPLRLDILNVIDTNEEVKVGDIYKALKIEQALASQQLRILRQADLVMTRRDQKFIFYRLNYPKIDMAGAKAPTLSEMVG